MKRRTFLQGICAIPFVAALAKVNTKPIIDNPGVNGKSPGLSSLKKTKSIKSINSGFIEALDANVRKAYEGQKSLLRRGN